MKGKKLYQFNELLNELEKCCRNKQYEQMSEVYEEMDNIIYGKEECIMEDARLLRRTFFVPFLENNLIEIPKEIVKALNISDYDYLSIAAIKYPNFITIYAEKISSTGSIDVYGYEPFCNYKIRINKSKYVIKIKDIIVDVMGIKLYDILQIDFSNGIMCIKIYQMPFIYSF